MARLPRLEIPNFPHLVLLRTRGDRPAFVDDEDRRAFCEALGFVVRRWAVPLHAYALARHSALLLLTPQATGVLPGAMQQLNRRYVAAVHARRPGFGAVWAGRYGASVVDPVGSMLTCMRLVDQEPVAQALCEQAIDWPWSSARRLAGARPDGLLTLPDAYWRLGNTPFDREAAYRELLNSAAPLERAAILRDAATGWPIGDASFLEGLSKLTSRRVKRRPAGRPADA